MTLRNLRVVHRRREVLSVDLAYVRQMPRENERRELPDTEFADLLPPLGRSLECALIAGADQPVLAEIVGLHADAVIDDGNEGIQNGAIRREDYVDVCRTGI